MNALYRLLRIFRFGESWKYKDQWLLILDLMLDSDTYEAPFRAILEEVKHLISPPHDEASLDLSDEQLLVCPKKIDLEQINEGFLVSVAAGNKDVADYYLDKGADINALDKDNQCGLAIAIRKDHHDMAYQLWERGLTYNFLMPDGTTPLIIGFTEKKFDELNRFFSMHRLQFTDNELQIIFEHACETASLDILNFLLPKAVTQNKIDMLRTYNPEFLKSEEDPSVLEVLLAHGVVAEEGRQRLFLWMCTAARMHLIEGFLSSNPEFDPVLCDALPFDEIGQVLNCGPPDDSCCICWATTEASPAVLSVLLGRVVQIHTRDRILGHLWIAAQRGHCGIAEELLKRGDDPNRPCSSGMSLIHYAARDCILEREPNSSTSDPEYSPSNKGSVEGRGDHARMIKIIETAGGDMKATYQGNNGIHYAMRNRSLSAATYLASRGVDLHATNCRGEQPLHVACFWGFKAGVDLILQDRHLIEPINEAADNLGTPLYCAAIRGHITIAEKLLGAGALVNAIALPGNRLGPALYVACANGHVQLVTILLSHGADQNLKGPRYHSASEVAIAYEQKGVLEALKKYGKSSSTSSGIQSIPD